MKKFLLITVLLVTGAIAAAPWVAGYFTEAELQAKVAEMQKRITWADVSIALEDYQRGYTTSTATLRLDKTRLLLKIQHAPLSLTAWDIARIAIKNPGNYLPDGDLRVNLVRQLLWKQELPQYHTNTNRFDGGEFVISGPEKTFPHDNHLRFIVRGLSGEGTTLTPTKFNLTWNKDKISLDNESLFLKVKAGSLDIKGLHAALSMLEVKGKRIPSGLEFHLAGLQATAAEGQEKPQLNNFHNVTFATYLVPNGNGYDLTGDEEYHFTMQGKMREEAERLFAVAPDSYVAKSRIGGLGADTVQVAANVVQILTDDIIRGKASSASDNLSMPLAAAGLSLYQDLLMRDLSFHYQLETGKNGKGFHLDIHLLEHFKTQAEFKEIEKDPHAIARFLYGSTLHARIDQEWLASDAAKAFGWSEKLQNAGFVADENGYTLDFAVQENGLARNGTLLTDEEIAAIPQQFDALLSGLGQ